MTDAPHATWVKAPGSPAAARWLTRTGCRTVLVMVPHMTAGTRLTDLLPLLEADHRIQVVFTVPAMADGWHGAEEYLRSWGGLVLPWHQVLRMRFDLVLAASHSQIDQVDGPVLVVPHGVGSRSRRTPWDADLGLRDLLVRDGRVVPAAVAVAHEREARQVRRCCPEAAPRTFVAGDPCLDRIEASLPLRPLYRRALGVRPGQCLVVVSSTWSRRSLFGGDGRLLDRVLDALPRSRYRIVAALHPNIWAVHGGWQVRAWLSAHLRSGVALLPPEEGWRAALVAADVVLGDHGSVTQYAAGIGVPVLVAPGSAADVRPGSVAALLHRTAPVLRPAACPRALVREARLGWARQRSAMVAARLTSNRGQAGPSLRRAMYRLLGLAEPAHPAPVSPVPLPAEVPDGR
ncbi:hypothetical protein B0I33_11490 [Prauserella shujinwangii]|uniref:CDP-glycerol:poly(Glycerophosphate) glycerophosphotransferase n=1 Tax=Prauserella shujinwangii TaxID=1453103 RepID=A0A2T0LKZ8_9PSEU|nr:hypothetical protein [Prauserella shujinwangii]PRX43629.1 hypothetical protein B0I33_11490 [Prauserella shujinwangii]